MAFKDLIESGVFEEPRPSRGGDGYTDGYVYRFADHVAGGCLIVEGLKFHIQDIYVQSLEVPPNLEGVYVVRCSGVSGCMKVPDQDRIQQSFHSFTFFYSAEPNFEFTTRMNRYTNTGSWTVD